MMADRARFELFGDDMAKLQKIWMRLIEDEDTKAPQNRTALISRLINDVYIGMFFDEIEAEEKTP